jgi:hypothetical protein
MVEQTLHTAGAAAAASPMTGLDIIQQLQTNKTAT